MSDAPDLFLIESTELIGELKRRHDAILIVSLDHRARDRSMVDIQSKGAVVTVIGLAEYAKDRVLSTPDDDPPMDDDTLEGDDD